MRTLLLPFAFLPFLTMACTTFKVTQDGRTLVGCNEDAWSINAQVRFEQGRNGRFGAIYFGHFNGSPGRSMTDQVGMNEAGLVFDGLSIQQKITAPGPGTRHVQFDALMPLVMRTCATVQEAAALLRTHDLSWLTRSMLFLADSTGEYLIVESDTLLFGRDPSFAVGNWRMSTCTDPDAIPIPRLQAGRSLLADSASASVQHGTSVLQRMQACRAKLGEGTLFSVLFDTQRTQAHLYFYHDFTERITFDLQHELAQGDRMLPMAALFGDRPEYTALVGYITPFHQRPLFWVLAAFGGSMLLLTSICGVLVVARTIERLRRKAARSLLPPVLVGAVGMLCAGITALLLLNEGVYYFGLGTVGPWAAWLPLLLCVLLSMLLWSLRHAGRRRIIGMAFFLPFLILLGYWGLLWP